MTFDAGYWVGIDPGITGALAAIDAADGSIELFDTPTFQDGNRTRIDVHGATDLIRYLQLDKGKAISAVLEKSQPMPHIGKGNVGKGGKSTGHGSIASFSLGYSFGVWNGILTAMQVPYRLVTPQSWKKSMMPGEAKEKDASRIVAIRMFPRAADSLKRKKDNGRSDALLMAEYGRRTMESA